MKYKKNLKVAILMATYNGEQFLEDQLNSIWNQEYKNWLIYISDDGSNDNTLTISKAYQKLWGKNKLHILKGPGLNFQNNFLFLINHNKIIADIYFLCDQDDIWMSHKLSHIINMFKSSDFNKPWLYCGRSKYISSDAKNVLGMSALFLKPTSFKNAIVQSIAGGNTMAFNLALKKISQRCIETEIVSHDWWLYILNELSGGDTFYDTEPTIFYRQHTKSLIGSNTGFFAKFKRFMMLLRGDYRKFNTMHLKALKKNYISTSKENIRVINDFFILRDKPLFQRIAMINHLGLYRQTLDGMIALYLGAIFHLL